ncbi:MAG: type II secretion system protein [Candidatus Colwellbacteria bacterium]
MKNNKGFTLIELIVSFSIFIVLITLTTATFVQTLKTQQIVGGLSASMNEVSFVTEQMAREMRTGTDFKNIAGEETIQFTNANSELVSYKKVNNGANDGIARCVGACEADQDYQLLTSPEVKINVLKFILMGNGRDDGAPRITIVTAVQGPKDINVNLETTVSARNIDNET